MISPSIVTRSPSRLIVLDVNVRSGWVWASKKSGLCRCAARLSSLASVRSRPRIVTIDPVGWRLVGRCTTHEGHVEFPGHGPCGTRLLDLVPLENRIRLVTCGSSGYQAARAYSLI